MYTYMKQKTYETQQGQDRNIEKYKLLYKHKPNQLGTLKNH